MEKTKCLFDEKKQTPEGMVSVSQLQTFMSCPKKWEYGYIENLTPRVERPYLNIGRLCHKGMQECMTYKWKHERELGYCREKALNSALQEMDTMWKEYMKVTSFLQEEIPEQEQILRDAKSVFTQAFWEFDIDRYDVLTLYDGEKEIPALELHFVVPCAGSKGLHGYIDAILREKETGHIWCTDYKFRKSLSPDEEEETNIQNAVYTHACKKMGIDITGTMTWQHVNTPASDPQILKSGGVSKAKIKTTWERYLAFCIENGIDPAPYEEEMREKLADIEFFRSTYEYRNDETIKNMWSQVVVPASRAVQRARNVKNKKYRFLYPWNCKMCQFRDLCQAELRNHDADFLRQSEYVQRHRTTGQNS
jgi:CRISPR/Cas system-associated exonuclease Cas4 (RecB family)